jgi:hypothetical protein
MPRTAGERARFAALWEAVGVRLDPGEQMVRCPFHDDHHPSLHVDADGCRWFCFGCRRGGGIQALRRLVQAGATPSAPPRPASLGPTEPPSLAPEVTVEVVGESYHQDELLALTGGRRTWSGAHREVLARLVPDDDDRFDPLAVKVVIEGRLVGHVPRAAARRYRPSIAEAIRAAGVATCRGEIRGGWERSGDVGWFGVVLHLPRLA